MRRCPACRGRRLVQFIGPYADHGAPNEAQAIGEGFSDYLAVTATLWKTGPGAIDDEACWLDWISKAEGKDCIRRVHSDRRTPAT